MFNLMRAMKGESRSVPKRELAPEEKEEQKNWIQQEFTKDHLRMRFNIDFTKGSVPGISSTNNPQRDAILAQVPRLSNPRPDVVFSLYRTAFPLEMQDLFRHLGCNLNGPDAYHVFALIKCKCLNASIQEAENQILTGGSSAVSRRRIYNHGVAVKRIRGNCVPSQLSPDARGTSSARPSPPMIAPTDIESGPKPDLDSWIFTFAVAADQAKSFVNWCLVNPSGELHWHMHLLNVYSFNKAADIALLRHDLDNVLDWGVGPVKRKVSLQAQAKFDSGELITNNAAPNAKRKRANEGNI